MQDHTVLEFLVVFTNVMVASCASAGAKHACLLLRLPCPSTHEHLILKHCTSIKHCMKDYYVASSPSPGLATRLASQARSDPSFIKYSRTVLVSLRLAK